VPPPGKLPINAGPPNQIGNLGGIIAMVIAMAAFTCGDTLMKLASVSLPTGVLVFFRGLFITSTVLTVIIASGHFADLKRAMHPVVAIRAGGDLGGALFFQTALARMPLADLMAINQLNPLMITAGSALVFKDNVGWRRWTATVVGFLGVLLIIRPGTSAFSWWALAEVGAVVCSTVRDLATRRIDPAIPTLCVLIYSSSLVAVGGLALAAFEGWTTPTPKQLVLVLAASLFSMIGQTCIIIAMRAGELSVIAPFRYTLLLFAIALGYVVWGDLPDRFAVIGMAIVVGAGLYTLHREQVRRREAALGHARRS
jgi:drug/metabolite transporter (DMT)-like permease